jgi:hypothetical protein
MEVMIQTQVNQLLELLRDTKSTFYEKVEPKIVSTFIKI